MGIFSKLSPTSPDGRRIAMCALFILVAYVLVFWLQAQVLFSDVRVNVVMDLFQIFSLTMISLAFCLHSNRKEQLAALCVSLVFCSLASSLCSGKINAKIRRFQNPDKYSLMVQNEVTVKGKIIRIYLVRDQKYNGILVARVEPINEQIALYWPLMKIGHTNQAKLSVYADSIVVTGGHQPRAEIKVIPLSAIP